MMIFVSLIALSMLFLGINALIAQLLALGFEIL